MDTPSPLHTQNFTEEPKIGSSRKPQRNTRAILQQQKVGKSRRGPDAMTDLSTYRPHVEKLFGIVCSTWTCCVIRLVASREGGSSMHGPGRVRLSPKSKFHFFSSHFFGKIRVFGYPQIYLDYLVNSRVLEVRCSQGLQSWHSAGHIL